MHRLPFRRGTRGTARSHPGVVSRVARPTSVAAMRIGDTLRGDRRGWRGWRAARELGVDIGTTAVRIATVTRVVVDEPSVVAHDRTGRVIAIGRDALAILGRNPRQVTVTRPVRDATIADVAAAEQLLATLIRRVARRRRPTVVAAVSLVATGLERRAIRHALHAAGARDVVLVETPMAAAIGADLPVEEAFGSMVVDVGRGATEAAVVSLGAIVTARAERIGGAVADATLARHLREVHGIAVGEVSAEAAKLALATAGDELEVRGVDVASGLPRSLLLPRDELRDALDDVVDAIAQTAKNALDAAPATLAADVMEEGIALTGGGSLLAPVADRVARLTGVAVRVPARPEHAVITGVRACLEASVGLGAS